MKDVTAYTDEVLNLFKHYFGNRKPKDILDILTHNIYLGDTKNFDAEFTTSGSDLIIRGGHDPFNKHVGVKNDFFVRINHHLINLELYYPDNYTKRGGQLAQFIYNLETTTNLSSEISSVALKDPVTIHSQLNFSLAGGNLEVKKGTIIFSPNQDRDFEPKIIREAYYNVKNASRMEKFQKKIPTSMLTQIKEAEPLVKSFLETNRF